MKNDEGELGRKLGQGACPRPWKLYTQGHTGATDHQAQTLPSLAPTPSLPQRPHLDRSRPESLDLYQTDCTVSTLGEATQPPVLPSVQSSRERHRHGRTEPQEEGNQPTNTSNRQIVALANCPHFRLSKHSLVCKRGRHAGWTLNSYLFSVLVCGYPPSATGPVSQRTEKAASFFPYGDPKAEESLQATGGAPSFTGTSPAWRLTGEERKTEVETGVAVWLFEVPQPAQRREGKSGHSRLLSVHPMPGAFGGTSSLEP